MSAAEDGPFARINRAADKTRRRAINCSSGGGGGRINHATGQRKRVHVKRGGKSKTDTQCKHGRTMAGQIPGP